MKYRKYISLHTSGPATIDAAGIKAKKCNAETSGASRISVCGTDSMTLSSSGASTVKYSGTCDESRIIKESSRASHIARR